MKRNLLKMLSLLLCGVMLLLAVPMTVPPKKKPTCILQN